MKLLSILICLMTNTVKIVGVTTATVDGLVYSLSGTQATIINYTSSVATDLIIPEKILYDGETYTVTCIGNRQYGNSQWATTGAFYNCTKLKSIIIPSTVTNIIGNYQSNPDNSPSLDGQVFYGCSNLETVHFKGNTSIGANAFYGCRSLRNVVFEKSVSIGQCTFWKCTSLKYIVLPSGTIAHSDAFRECDKIQDIICLGDNIVTLNLSNVNYYTRKDFILWVNNTYDYSGNSPVLPSFDINIPRGFVPIINGSVSLSKDVGQYTIPIPFTFINEDMSFTVDIPYSFTINPITLIARVKNSTKEYGEANPQFESEYSGFITGEDESVITSHGAYSTLASTGSSVGTYSVSQSGATAKNYTFNYESGTLTVTKAPLTIIPRDKTMTYGEPLPTFDVDYTGLKNNEMKPAWITEPTIGTKATQTSNAGTYQITVTGGEARNYDVTAKTGTLTISKAALTATTQSATREYGDENPDFKMTYSGLKNNETAPEWAVLPSLVSPATKMSPVGTYTITATGGEAKNYNVQFINKGELTVTKAPLTAKARSFTKTQGDSNPTLVIDYIGFKNGETKAVLTKEPTISTTATKDSRAGTYPIVVSGGVAMNYEFNYENGTMTITARQDQGDPTANMLTLGNATGSKTKQPVIAIALKNEKQITGLQFDLYLPTGVTVATKTNGKLMINTTDRMEGSYSVTGSSMEGGQYVRVVGYSADSDPFTGTSGDILNITLNVSEYVADGNYIVSIKDIVLSDVDNTEYHPANAEGQLTVKSFTLGDVDDSGAVNINDVVCIINYILNKTKGVFIEDAADVDQNGSININDVVTLINRFILHRTEAKVATMSKMMKTQSMTDDNYMHLAEISINPGETIDVEMLLDNTNEVKAVQGNIKLPEGLTFATKSNGRLAVTNNEQRAEDFTLSCALQEDGSMTFAQYSADGFAYEGSKGKLFSFKIQAAEDAVPGKYQIGLSEMVLSIGGVAYEQTNTTSTVNILSATTVESIIAENPADVYSVSGRKVRQNAKTLKGLPTGVYIVNGRKVVVK